MAELNRKEYKTEFAGQTLSLTVSKIAEQATAAVMGQYGDTNVLVTVTMGKENKSSDYFPLVVDYEEKFYAAGKIIGSRFVRREGRPSEEAVLSGRLIDRSLRPLFDQRIRREVQVVITVLSYDEENDPDFIAMLTASTALMISEIPWNGPAAGVRIAKTIDGQIIINPKNSQIKDLADKISFEAFISGTREKINMIELAGREAQESDVADSFIEAMKPINEILDFQAKVVKDLASPKVDLGLKSNDEVQAKVAAFLNGKIEDAVYVGNKMETEEKLRELKKELFESLKAEDALELNEVDLFFDEEIGNVVRKNILEKDRRPDGRKLDEVRDLLAEVGLFKRLHGSALFIRGNTQALAVTTLAAPGAEQMIESMELSGKRRFMLHYNFPPYSVGETGRMGATGRREIGHGALAEKALRPLIPSKEEFPYTIRLV
ncbi:MAG: polyribonucleotide nucleotidyltransferase [Candidatus Wolfebacteria bacterium]|nr:polyribonucleotide nucleotidyltransferase [Candidatus Wolfebacteria bacterium]